MLCLTPTSWGVTRVGAKELNLTSYRFLISFSL